MPNETRPKHEPEVVQAIAAADPALQEILGTIGSMGQADEVEAARLDEVKRRRRVGSSPATRIPDRPK